MTASASGSLILISASNWPVSFASRPSRVSRSMRTTCCWCATMRVLTLVWRAEFVTRPLQPMFCSAKKFLQLPAGIVVANRAEQFRRTFERDQVARDIGRAAGHEAFALKIHHRHRRFRRNARHAAPDELVEHHVADDEDAGFRAAARICGRGQPARLCNSRPMFNRNWPVKEIKN